MPTLLSINNYYYRRGGAESVFLDHNALFEEDKWQVVPFAMKHGSNLPTPWDRYFVDEIEYGARYSAREKLVRATRVIYSVQARRLLSELLDASMPDLCHAHNIYHHISPSILGLLAERSLPVIMTLHDLKIACPAYNMLTHDGVCERCRGGRLYNVVLNRCIKGSLSLSALAMLEATLHRAIGSYRNNVARFVVPSLFYAEKLQQWGMPADKFRHIPNFVASEKLQPNFLPGERVLYFGRLSTEKGLRTLIHAASKIACKVEIAGTGPDLSALRKLAVDLGVDVKFLGFLSGNALHDAVRASRAVVLPSEWYENAPISVLEAYALGKPVIGADIGGIPELVRPGITGSLFPSGDANALAAELDSINGMENSLVAEMGREARRLVETRYTASRYRMQMKQLYQEFGVHDSGSINAVMSGP
jgi:glycosyltransferase involved in cell wall biosynthesis